MLRRRRLYESEAVLWGTRSPTLRDNPATVRDYFNLLSTVPPDYKVVIDEQRIRVYGDIAINTGTYTLSEVRDDKPDHSSFTVQLCLPESRRALADCGSPLVCRTCASSVGVQARAPVLVQAGALVRLRAFG